MAINSRDTDNLNASLIHIASEKGDLEMIKLLIKFGGDVNA
jgi:ankyrin repeat protein